MAEQVGDFSLQKGAEAGRGRPSVCPQAPFPGPRHTVSGLMSHGHFHIELQATGCTV